MYQFVCIYPILVIMQHSEYLNTLGELHGFMSHHCDIVVIAGDFNNCGGPILFNFMSGLNLYASDLPFIGFTYEGYNSRSWIDHVLCSSSFCSGLSGFSTLKSGHILSDHLPLAMFPLSCGLYCCN